MKWLKNLFSKKEVEECKPRWVTKTTLKLKSVLMIQDIKDTIFYVMYIMKKSGKNLMEQNLALIL